MNSRQPIHTEKIRCQDCYKCVRQCPVKAIHVVNDSAAITHERCVYCGICVNVCPVGAKKVRDDLGRARLLLKRKARVVVSLAPSFVAEFPGVAPGSLIHAIKTLGFAGVSETALGAEEVSAACARALAAGDPGIYISTACPTVVEYIRKYHPERTANLTRFISPILAHCKLLRREYGEDTGVVFVGPCISKKLEGDNHPDLLDVVLTFHDLRRWFEDLGIDPAQEPQDPGDVFVPQRATAGALYPVDGGMIKGIEAGRGSDGIKYMAFSGMHNLQTVMEGLEGLPKDRKVFLELLACEGGCVNGPQTLRTCGTALKWLRVLDFFPERPLRAPGPTLDLGMDYDQDPVLETAHGPAEILRALRRLGKTTAEDELNCGGCGYDQCRSLASALLDGRAEPNMCVSHMRKLAMNKANALIRSMPNGVVIVDEGLSIVECNRKFAEFLGEETLLVYDAKPGMGGASLVKVAPFHRLFTDALDLEEGAISKDFRLGERVLRVLVFPVESGRMVGGILQDITEPAVERDQIIQKAQDIIRKNVTTVQQIAYLLGENAAETEMVLGSIIDSFQVTPGRTPEPRP
jgi:iron only hydrogenase large subunit-like protein